MLIVIVVLCATVIIAAMLIIIVVLFATVIIATMLIVLVVFGCHCHLCTEVHFRKVDDHVLHDSSQSHKCVSHSSTCHQ